MELFDRSRIDSLLLVRQPEVEARQKIVVHIERGLELFNCLVILPCVKVMPAQMCVEDQAHRVQFQSGEALFEGFLRLADCHEVVGVPMVSIIVL